jgi:hypothetical protein
VFVNSFNRKRWQSVRAAVGHLFVHLNAGIMAAGAATISCRAAGKQSDGSGPRRAQSSIMSMAG